MWSHYADYHRGICIRYKPIFHPNNPRGDQYSFLLRQAGQPIASEFYNVIYKNKVHEKLNILLFMHEHFNKFLYTKFCEWKYEQEYRLILLHDTGIVNYGESVLEGVVLGSKITPNHAKLVYEAIKKKHNIAHVNFYEAKEEPHHYAIISEKIKNIAEYIDNLKLSTT